MSLLQVLAPAILLWNVMSWLQPFKGHCEPKAMQAKGIIYVAGHPLLNRRCAILPEYIHLRNYLYCVGWGIVTLLTQSSLPAFFIFAFKSLLTTY